MASGTACYKRIIDLLEKWPTDKSKAGRDLGQFLRDSYNRAYKQNLFETNHKHWDRQYFALQRLISEEHKNKYPRLLSSSATGLTAEECKIAVSNEVLEELQKEDKPFFKKLFSLRSTQSDAGRS